MKKAQIIDEFFARQYQQSIFANSLDKNTLVILPTGLGKTVIAIMLAIYYYNKNNKKILFLAPTKPLVEQQQKSFQEFIKNSDEFNFQTLTGLVSPAKRKELYEKNDFIFSTPQLIENDIINKTIDPDKFSLVIVDEAHRATKGYAYTFIAGEFSKHSSKILALSASPGAGKEEINDVINNLHIEHIEVKKYEDSDVKPHIKQTKVENIKIELPENLKKIKELLNKTYSKRIAELKGIEFINTKNLAGKKDLLDLQSQLRLKISQGEADDDVWRAISLAAGLMKLQYGIELFESQEISAAHTYFYNFFREGGDKSKAAQELLIDVDFREAFDRISELKKDNIEHPKLTKLKEIVRKEINDDANLKIIIFNQYRETAQKIVQELEKIKEIKPALFVGQAKKGDMKLSQKEQKRILEDFRESKYNIIVSTSVGEEGLDIPKVDLVIFYEPVPSAIRTIQRVGRTGRFKKGRAYVLITQDTRDVVTNHISNAKERKMYKVLDEVKDEFSSRQKDIGLKKFLNQNSKGNGDENSEKKDDLAKNHIPKIYIDNRENSDLIKELYRIEEIEIEAKKLDIADIVITDNIAIERKSKKDFVNSILDKRLFPQLIDLAKNYRRPILIIEGEENIFAIRQLNPNVIRSTLSAIAIDLRIPIIYTNSLLESAQMIQTITKRTKREKREISLAINKASFSENEELEKFISTIPKINVVTAKALLSHFNTIKDLVNAPQKQIEECEGIGKIRAKYLKEFFEKEYKNL